MARKIVWEITDDVLIVKASRVGRLAAGLYSGLKTFPLAMGALAIFFAPDYLFGRITADEPVPGLFWLSLGLLALFGSTLWAALRYLRLDRWIFDGQSKRLVAEVRSLFGAPAVGEAELRELDALLLYSRSGLRQSSLRVRLSSGEEEVLFSGNGLSDELEEVGEAIIEFLRDHRVQVALERVDEKRIGQE